MRTTVRVTLPLLACLVLGLGKCVHAYPGLWIDPGMIGSNRPPAPCLVHPEEAYGAHKSLSTDSTMGISVLEQDAAVTRVCPGGTYVVRVNFGETIRRSLITATYGTFASNVIRDTVAFWYPKDGSSANVCPNRISAVGASIVTDSIEIPCDASGALQIKVTSAAGPAPFQQASQSFRLDANCATATCVAASAPVDEQQPAPVNDDDDEPVITPTKPAPSKDTKPATTPATTPAQTPKENDDDGDDDEPKKAWEKPADKDEDDKDDDDEDQDASAHAGHDAPSCEASDLGYTCVKALGSVKVHYSVGGKMPSNPCTDGGSALGETAGADVLHMAVESATNGYLSVAFAAKAGAMIPADAVIGWVSSDNVPSVDTYQIKRIAIKSEDIVNWATFKGVSRQGDNLLVCFTRKLAEPNALVSQTLDVSQDLQLNWASSPQPRLMRHDAVGSATLNVLTGELHEVASKQELRIRWHGALMSAAWALLLPLGTLLPRHRWALGQSHLLGKQAWFTLHIVCQTVGLSLMVAGFAVAWYYFDEPEEGDDLGKTHQVLGTIVFAFACIQFLTAFIRPDPSHQLRPIFNYFHWWWGRVTVVAAWVTIYLGIALFHTSMFQARLVQWITPVAVSMGVIVLGDALLTLVALLKGKPLGSTPQPAPKQSLDGTTDADEIALSAAAKYTLKAKPSVDNEERSSFRIGVGNQ